MHYDTARNDADITSAGSDGLHDIPSKYLHACCTDLNRDHSILIMGFDSRAKRPTDLEARLGSSVLRFSLRSQLSLTVPVHRSSIWLHISMGAKKRRRGVYCPVILRHGLVTKGNFSK